MRDTLWNPWHGCVKYSEGCRLCYVYRRDESIGRNAREIYRTKDFDLPLRKNRAGDYKIPSGTSVFLCMTSDFFLDLADPWRGEIWDIIRQRSDLRFTVITKRIERFSKCLPADWGNGWEHVTIACTIENQAACDRRFPIFIKAPIRHKMIVCEPLLSAIDMRAYLTPEIEFLTCGGESGPGAHICDYDWILSLREQCLDCGVRFSFKQTGANFRKDGKLYHIERKFQHSQAKKAGINT